METNIVKKQLQMMFRVPLPSGPSTQPFTNNESGVLFCSIEVKHILYVKDGYPKMQKASGQALRRKLDAMGMLSLLS